MKEQIIIYNNNDDEKQQRRGVVVENKKGSRDEEHSFMLIPVQSTPVSRWRCTSKVINVQQNYNV